MYDCPQWVSFFISLRECFLTSQELPPNHAPAPHWINSNAAFHSFGRFQVIRPTCPIHPSGRPSFRRLCPRQVRAPPRTAPANSNLRALVLSRVLSGRLGTPSRQIVIFPPSKLMNVVNPPLLCSEMSSSNGLDVGRS